MTSWHILSIFHYFSTSTCYLVIFCVLIDQFTISY
nr:MAG TPA: hypothetical protein [Caudoviricetes sp.]